MQTTYPCGALLPLPTMVMYYHCEELNTEVTILWADASGEICQEKKVLYKLICGLHSSISIHIAADYLLDKTTNLPVTKAKYYLEQAEYDAGNPEEDLKAQSLMRQLLYNQKLQAACAIPFDEAKLWKGQSGPELKQQIQKQFRNISTLSWIV
ncbi:hypothetical protein P3L10_033889 [Capsicum annuum]